MKRVLGTILVAAVVVLGAPHADAAMPACGDTIKKNVKLTVDLTGCPGDGLVVGRSNITIDLGGQAIHRASGAAGVAEGIDNTGGFDGVTVRNGSIEGFTNGVEFRDASDGVIAGLEVVDNGGGIKLVAASKNNVVRGNAVASNDFSGISVVGVDDDVPVGNALLRNTAVNNGRGLEVIAARRTRVAGGDVYDNIGIGAYVGGSTATTLDGVVIQQNGVEGVKVVDSARTRVIGTRLSSNAMGLRMENADRSLIRDNNINENDAHGIDVRSGSSENEIVGNESHNNGASGIALLPGASNNTVADNLTGINRFAGIFVEEGATGNVVIENQAIENGTHGIETHAIVRISRNVANDNGFGVGPFVDNNVGLGITAPDGTPGSGNKATGNDDPAQCAPAALCGP